MHQSKFTWAINETKQNLRETTIYHWRFKKINIKNPTKNSKKNNLYKQTTTSLPETSLRS